MDTPGQPARSERNSSSAAEFSKSLAPYRRPSHRRSTFELLVTGTSFFALWGAAWWALSISYWLTLAISIPAGAFLIRLFLIKHDCGHGAFFRRQSVNNWVGRVLGVLTLTPYDVWRRSHATHHATSGNLDKRGIGDIDTLTIDEYRALPRMRKIVYRLYRHPLVMFGLGPSYQFLLRNRLPHGVKRGDRRFWISTMGTNAAMAVVVGAAIVFLGAGPFLLVQLPITIAAASMGVWLFYIQHQFEDTYWSKGDTWILQDAALQGSSHYVLPKPLSWITANIGIHHVHHLSSRIPFYRLPQVLRDYPNLDSPGSLTLSQSLKCLRLRLWDEGRRELVSFADAKSRPLPSKAG